MNEIIIPVICCCVMMLVWLLSSTINRCAVSPGALFSGSWFFASVIPIVPTIIFDCEMKNMDFSYILVTVICVLVFITSDSFSLNSCKTKIGIVRRICGNSLKKLKHFYWISLLVSFFYPIVLYGMARKYFGAEKFYKIPGLISHAKYTETWTPSSFLNLFMMAIFICAIIAGFLLAIDNSRLKNKIFYYFWIIPVFLAAYLTAARSAMAQPIVFWLASYICGRAFVCAEKRIKVKKVFLIIIGIIIFSFIIVHTGYMLRSKVLNFNESKIFLGKSVSTMAGHMLVMQDWIEKGGLWHSEHKTIYTFAGIAKLLGIGKRISGLYDENVTINYGGELSNSNIYTAFRPLIDDFGLAGAFLCIGFLSFIASVSWFYLQGGSIWGYPSLLIFNSYVLWSPITSIYTYNSSIGATLISSFLIICTLRGKKLFWDTKDEKES